MKKDMAKYILLNIMAPGFGQLAMKKYFRGGIQFLAVIAGIIWLVVVFGTQMVALYDHAVNGGDIAIQWNLFIAPSVFIVLVWLLSFVDLIFFCKPPEPKQPPLPDRNS